MVQAKLGCTVTVCRCGAGRQSWGEGVADPSDYKRGPGDTERSKYAVREMEAWQEEDTI